MECVSLSLCVVKSGERRKYWEQNEDASESVSVCVRVHWMLLSGWSVSELLQATFRFPFRSICTKSKLHIEIWMRKRNARYTHPHKKKLPLHFESYEHILVDGITYVLCMYAQLQDNNLTNSRISAWKCKRKFFGTENGLRWKLNIQTYLQFEINSKFPYRIVAVNGWVEWNGGEYDGRRMSKTETIRNVSDGKAKKKWVQKHHQNPTKLCCPNDANALAVDIFTQSKYTHTILCYHWFVFDKLSIYRHKLNQIQHFEMKRKSDQKMDSKSNGYLRYGVYICIHGLWYTYSVSMTTRTTLILMIDQSINWDDDEIVGWVDGNTIMIMMTVVVVVVVVVILATRARQYTIHGGKFSFIHPFKHSNLFWLQFEWKFFALFG